MDDEEDIKKLDAILSEHKKEALKHDDFEYDEFINYVENSDSENDSEDCVFTEYAEPSTPLPTHLPSSVLKHEEKAVIDSCEDHELKEVLVLNRNKNMHLMQLYKQIKDALVECRVNLERKQKHVDELRQKTRVNVYLKGVWRLGHPYFKDMDLYTHPSNEDTLKKKKNCELSFYDLLPLPRWTSAEMTKLTKAVQLNYNCNQRNEIHKQIEKLTEKMQLEEIDNGAELLNELKEKLLHLEDDENHELPPVNSNELVDYNRISEVFFKGKRTEIECKSMWNLYLHPSINKSKFTTKESKKLLSLVSKYDKQNWERICAELDTNRTPFTVCMHYYRQLHDKFKKNERFTQAEDELLFGLVKKYSIGDYIPWVKIAEHFRDRNRQQIFYRYKYYLEKSGKCKMGRFSDEEDVLLMILVDRFGRKFKVCAEYFGNRSSVQLKSRYNSNLCGALKKGTFTIEEDIEIMEYAKEHNEKNWRNLGLKLKRASGQIRQRYDTIVQYLKDNPGSGIKDVIRRKHSYVGENDDNFHYLRFVADAYKKHEKIPTLRELKSFLLRNRPSSNVTGLEGVLIQPPGQIDDLLIDYFSDSYKLKSQNHISNTLVKSSVNLVADMLDLLNVRLEVPEHFHDDIRLDNIDHDILVALAKTRDIRGKSEKKYAPVSKLVPPNLHTLVGMRSLLIKYRSKGSRHDVNIFNPMPNEIAIDVVETNSKDLSERRIFVDRFFSLFKLPAIMTLQEPSKHFVTSFENYTVNYTLHQTKRSYEKREVNENLQKKIKIRSDKELLASEKTVVFKSLASKLKDKIKEEIGLLSGKKKATNVNTNNEHILSLTDTTIPTAVESYKPKRKRQTKNDAGEPDNQTPRLKVNIISVKKLNDADTVKNDCSISNKSDSCLSNKNDSCVSNKNDSRLSNNGDSCLSNKNSSLVSNNTDDCISNKSDGSKSDKSKSKTSNKNVKTARQTTKKTPPKRKRNSGPKKVEKKRAKPLVDPLRLIDDSTPFELNDGTHDVDDDLTTDDIKRAIVISDDEEERKLNFMLSETTDRGLGATEVDGSQKSDGFVASVPSTSKGCFEVGKAEFVVVNCDEDIMEDMEDVKKMELVLLKEQWMSDEDDY